MGTQTSLKMPKSEGYRCCTRDMFSRPFRQNGMPNLSTYLTNYKQGQYVDIKANSAIQKGMPPQVLPRTHWRRLQRHPTCCWRDRQQEGWWQDSCQASAC